MNKTYTRLRFQTAAAEASERMDLLVDALIEKGGIGVEHEADHVDAWFGPNPLSDLELDDLRLLLREHGVTGEPELHVEAERNWNAIWEASIKPLRIGSFLIRPSWEHGTPEDAMLTEIVIDPKMSFGTGSHATTHMILETIGDLDLTGRKVLDAGTGTGILAIAALKRGATSVFGFDEDEWSEVNAHENLMLNGISGGIDIRQGRFDVIPPGERYDLILANINTHVLLEEMGTLAAHLTPGGDLVMTGILAVEAQRIRERFRQEGLTEIRSRTLQEWILFHVSSREDAPSASSIRQDRDWVESILSGDQRSYSRLMEKHRAGLAYHIRGYVRDQGNIDDLVQEVFIKAFENLASYNPAYAFSTWIYRIATNHAIDHLRRRKIQAVSIHDPLQTKDGEMEREIPDHSMAPDRSVMLDQRRAILHDAIGRLPEKYRDVIRMRHMEEMSYQEISEETGLPLGTVKAHIFRAREALYKSLKDRRESF